ALINQCPYSIGQVAASPSASTSTLMVKPALFRSRSENPRKSTAPQPLDSSDERLVLLRGVVDGDAGSIEVYGGLLADEDCLAHGAFLHVDDLHSAVDFGQRLDAMERLAVRSGERCQSLQL